MKNNWIIAFRLGMVLLLALCGLTLAPAQAAPSGSFLSEYFAGSSFNRPDLCAPTFTHIYDIQGSGDTAATTGPVTTQGIVIGDYEGATPNLRGFFIQDAAGDANPATSDGIFVFNANNNVVSLGDLVQVSGTAEEYQGQTQISSVSTIVICGAGSITPTDLTLPFASSIVPERYEGMLVRFAQTLFVTDNYYLGRFDELELSSTSRLPQPTNVAVPGAPALTIQAANDLNRILLDDELNNQNPDPIKFGRGGSPLSASNTLRAGDSAQNIVGVFTYTWSGNAASGNAWRLRPINALGGGLPNFQPTNPRPVTGPGLWGSVSVASYNALNYFNTFDGLPDTVDNCTLGVGGASTDCRGADNQEEFDRQQAKIVAALTSIYADVIGLSEIENDGYGLNSAIQSLVDALNADLGAGTYAFIDADLGTGQVNALGTDAIKVALIYRPSTVTPVGQTAVLNTTEFVNGGDSAVRNRPSLAQAFKQNEDGAVFIVDVNHLKSKGSACDTPDQIDGQGNCSIVRTNAAKALAAWLATDPTGARDNDVLILGDLNSYAMEDPITALKNAGYTNLVASILGADAYSYSFDGQWGYLDHALYSPSMSGQVSDAAIHHVNADEPNILDFNTNNKSAGQITSLYSPDMYRAGDHDLLLIGLQLAPPTLLWLPLAQKN